jgi:hypothetical protein
MLGGYETILGIWMYYRKKGSKLFGCILIASLAVESQFQVQAHLHSVVLNILIH